MSWQNIRGHDTVVEHFRRLIGSGRLPHAMLFVGPPSIGKSTFARALARALLCSENPPELLNPCGQCPSCRQVDVETHPDLIIVRRPEEKQVIPVDTIRDEVCAKLSLKPMMGKNRVAIVEDADHLNEESSNAFLKTLEEPGPGSVLILIGTSPDNQIDTIVSRCQVVKFQPLSVDDIESILIEKQLVTSTDEARRLADVAEGSIARALALADQTYRSLFEIVISELAETTNPVAPSIAKQMEDHIKNCNKETPIQRRRAILLIEDISRFFREVLWAGAGLASPGGDTSRDRFARSMAQHCEPEDIFILADRTMLAISQIQSNGNMGLVLSAWAADVCHTLHQAALATK
ncbi:MAG: DNA polymerase III subunit delta' [bacterium]